MVATHVCSQHLLIIYSVNSSHLDMYKDLDIDCLSDNLNHTGTSCCRRHSYSCVLLLGTDSSGTLFLY